MKQYTTWNNMFKLMIFSLLFMLSGLTLYSQEIKLYSDSISRYNIGKESFSCSHFSIVNNTNKRSLIWFDKPYKESLESPFYNYFFKRNGDFSLFNIITEFGSTLYINDINSFPEIFKTFYKVINPGESFDIFVLSDYNIKEPIISSLIQTVTENEITKYNITLNEQFDRLSYKANYIILDLKK